MSCEVVTTCMTSIQSSDRVLLGDEVWPIVGNLLTLEQYRDIQQATVGLKRNWNCLEKAKTTQKVLGFGVVVVGSLLVWSYDYQSQYGYYFRLPFEFHAWVQVPGGIIDVALPGVIEMGLTTCDEVGPCLESREPFILAGMPPEWCEYKTYEAIPIGE